MSVATIEIALRAWRRGDEEVLPAIADDRRIWRNLTNRFPHPYRREDAVAWIDHADDDPDNARHHAIVADGAVVGGVGFERLGDLSTRTAEIGYWLGTAFWGRGIATRALALATTVAFRDFDFERLQAGVLAWNPASCRVLEKAGYVYEGRLRRHVYKDGEVCDQLLYAMLRADHEAR
jgi:RimJ/RimL family protein N-acetyltransferase